MNLPPENQKSDTTAIEPQAILDPEEKELQRQVMADIREFGLRKYLAFYNKAKQLKESGMESSAVRKDLVGEAPTPSPTPDGGMHFISKVHYAKQKAFHNVVRNAVEDALARRPPQFREEHSMWTEHS